jgi:hypothetical protein
LLIKCALPVTSEWDVSAPPVHHRRFTTAVSAPGQFTIGRFITGRFVASRGWEPGIPVKNFMLFFMIKINSVLKG